MFVTIICSCIAAWVLWTVLCLELNMHKASKMGIRCVRLPIDGNNILWMTVEPLIWKFIDALPFPWSSYPDSIRHLRRGWHFYDKHDNHARHGPVWALVSGVGINLQISDPDAIGEIFSRRRDFIRPVENYKILDVFGPCISSADTQNWPRHRKALSPPFNESIMDFVWKEALNQAQSMVEAWSRPEARHQGVASVQCDTRCLTLNILAATGFGKSYQFQDSQDQADGEISYRSALQTLLDNAILLMLVPHKVLMMPFMPKSWAKVGQAKDRFQSYMLQMLEESEASKKTSRASSGLMASLMQALGARQEQQQGASESPSPEPTLQKGLSLEEIFGNIFVINFAGHDTTANSLAFAMLLLARDPAVQSWVTEEIQEVTKGTRPEEWSYESIFDSLVRCRAVLYETLRLYPPIMALSKATNDQPQRLEVSGQSILIPPKTYITPNIIASHTNPAFWPEPLSWKPSRWIVRPSEAGGSERIMAPLKHTFFPWSDGPQICLGKKFSEVEFVAILACLFRDNRLEIKRNPGESSHNAMERLSSTIDDVNMELLLRMKDADRVRLCYLER